jgi:hypothetical protein
MREEGMRYPFPGPNYESPGCSLLSHLCTSTVSLRGNTKLLDQVDDSLEDQVPLWC